MARIGRPSGKTDTREKLLASSADLFRKRGFHGTGIKDVMAAAAAPSGSLYHFFPGGKEDLAIASARQSGDGYRRLIQKIASTVDTPADCIGVIFGYAADALERSDFADGCPIGTVALDAAVSHQDLRAVCADILQEWIDTLASALSESGWTEGEARSAASTAIAALEGAILISKAQRSTATLKNAELHTRRMLEHPQIARSQKPRKDARQPNARLRQTKSGAKRKATTTKRIPDQTD